MILLVIVFACRLICGCLTCCRLICGCLTFCRLICGCLTFCRLICCCLTFYRLACCRLICGCLTFCRMTDMGAEDFQHGLTQAFSAFRQVKELVGAAYTHGGPFMP